MSDLPSIPGYRVLRPLGVGGMASVYLAVQESLDREVALKVMAPALAANQEFTERFLKEGRITAKLSHANLVTIFDIGQYGNIYYLAAEYIPGGTLREKLTDGGVTIAEALDVAREVALGLHYAQEKGFVHRDVKPGNVLFKSNGSAVLADFGIAKSMDQKTMATQAGSSIGTPHYMSPEQARAEKVDGRSDLYSLGAMLFEMLTGSPPYDAGDPFTIALMHVTHPLPQLPADLQWLQPLINGLMAKSPDDRYPNGEAFSVAADKLLQAAPQGAAVRDGQDTRKRVVPRLSRTDQQTGVRGGGRSTHSRTSAGGVMRSPAVLYGGIAAAVLAVAVIGWLVFGGKTTAPSDPPVVVTPTQPDTTPTVDPPTVPITDLGGGTTSSDDVGGLIARANEYMKIGLVENGRRISSPPGDCAVDLYLRALSIDANNPEAKAGLGQIASYYESKAKAAYDRGIFNGSMVLAEQGLKADPGNTGLQKIAADSKKSLGL